MALMLSTMSFAQTNIVATAGETTALKSAQATTAAPTVYTSEADFKAAIKSDYSLNEFASCVKNTYYTSIVQSTGTYKYTITEISNSAGLYGLTGAFSTSFNKDSILITNNGASVYAFGGFFYNTDTNGAFKAGDIRVTVGTYSYVITAATTSKFVGFVFPEAITSVYIGYPKVQTSSPYCYASMDHLYWGSVATVPATVLTITNNVAGNLATALGTNLTSCKTLTVTGNIDARDFKTMRDAMTALTTIDLSGATIVQYTGTEGTSSSNSTSITYPANELPTKAFSGKTNLISLTSPSSMTAVGTYAFYNCNNLVTMNIPVSVTTIKVFAFSGCSSLTSVTIPKLVTTLGNNAFYNCSALMTVNVNNTNFSDIDGVLYNKLQTQLIQCPTSKTGAFTIPGSVTSIGSSAFYNCSVLTSIKVTTATPSNITLGSTVFENVNKTSCTLYVPTGSKTAYKAAEQWKDFTNIVEYTSTAVELPKSVSHLNIFISNNLLNISEVALGETITVYNINGTLINKQKAENSTVEIELPLHGMYIVQVGTISEKVIY